MRVGLVGAACVAVVAIACGSRAQLDQPAPFDAGPFVACNDDAQAGVRVQGVMADLDVGCAGIASDTPEVCWLGHSVCWSQQGLGPSNYTLEGLPNQEIILRMTSGNNVPRLEGIHPYDCQFQAFAFALPTPAFTAQLLAPIGGFDPTKAYLLFFAQGHSATTGSLCTGNVAGFALEADAGSVHYVDDSATVIDPKLTTTTAAGIAIIVVDAAPPLGSDPLVVRVSAHRESPKPSCTMLTGLHWQRSDPGSKTDFAADAPALAGHFTYALFVTCGAA